MRRNASLTVIFEQTVRVCHSKQLLDIQSAHDFKVNRSTEFISLVVIARVTVVGRQFRRWIKFDKYKFLSHQYMANITQSILTTS